MLRNKTLSIMFLITFLFAVMSLNFYPVEAQSQPTGKPLTNNDIVSLVKAGLSDTAIVLAIQKSPTQFDLSPVALVNLRKAGVNNMVIEAMIGGGGSSNTGEAKSPLIPTGYGYYVVDENQLIALKTSPVITKIGLRPGGPRSGNPGYAVDGFAGEPSLSIKNKLPIFLVYQQNVNITGFQFRDLVYVQTMQAYQFNIKKTNQAFFSNVFFVGYNDTIQIDLWRPNKVIPMSIEPVEEKTGMYRLIPQSPLESGRYTLYFKNDITQDGYIFTAASDRQASGFYFKVE